MSEMAINGRKTRCWQCCVSSGNARGEFTLLPVPPSRSCVHPWLVAAFFIFEASSIASTFQFLLDTAFVITSPLTLLPPSFPYKDPCDYFEPTQIVQDHLPNSRSLIISSKSLLPCKVIYSLAPSKRLGTSLWGLLFYLSQIGRLF